MLLDGPICTLRTNQACCWASELKHSVKVCERYCYSSRKRCTLALWCQLDLNSQQFYKPTLTSAAFKVLLLQKYLLDGRTTLSNSAAFQHMGLWGSVSDHFWDCTKPAVWHSHLLAWCDWSSVWGCFYQFYAQLFLSEMLLSIACTPMCQIWHPA